jgi:hypothetical protein
MTEADADRRAITTDIAPSTDVFPVLGGSWRATCDCGLTISVGDQPAGWTWIIDHSCARMHAAVHLTR